MGRVSTRENKTIYQLKREELGLSRERASELLETLTPERLEKIESQKTQPYPEEILTMSKKYKTPSLCNHYCSHDCPIGQKYVPEIKPRDLSQIILEMVASLNSMHRKQERLIEITADGRIEDDEIMDFVKIQEELEKISVTVETLQLWVEKKLADNVISTDDYNEYKMSSK